MLRLEAACLNKYYSHSSRFLYYYSANAFAADHSIQFFVPQQLVSHSNLSAFILCKLNKFFRYHRQTRCWNFDKNTQTLSFCFIGQYFWNYSKPIHKNFLVTGEALLFTDWMLYLLPNQQCQDNEGCLMQMTKTMSEISYIHYMELSW